MLLSLYVVVVLVQLFFWLYFFLPLAKAAGGCRKEMPKELPALSIIICARNEEQQLRKNLPLWLAQSYPAEWELLIVDDQSEDETVSICRKAMQSAPPGRLRLLSLTAANETGKKNALKRAIEAARHPYLLLTDADCRPASPHWALQMAAAFAEGKELVLGYSPFELKKGLLNAFERFEGLWTAVQYLGFAGRQMAYMGVGRNMAYSKMLYEQVGGFSGHEEVAYGDDDLFVQSVSGESEVYCCLCADGFVWTDTAESWRAYVRKKTRHFSAAKRYRFKDKLLLFFLSLSLVLFFALSFVLLFYWPHVVLLGVLLRYMVVWPLGVVLSKKLLQADLGWSWPLWELFFAIYLLFFSSVFLWFGKRGGISWRGRSV